MNSAASPKRVVLIMTDSQRWDMVGCYGNPEMRTPRLDGLAAQGVRYDRAYCCQPVCGPARSGIFTGTFPHTNGAWANSMALGDNVKTVGQRLSDRGVHTAYIGKWHLDGGDYFGLGRCPDGWDPAYWYDMRCYLNEMSPEDRVRSRKSASNRDGWVTTEKTYAHRCSDRAIRFLENNADEDFLLVVSYDEPHGPFLCPPKFREMFEGYEWPKNPSHWDDLENKPEHHRVWRDRPFDEQKINDTIITRPDYFGCNAFVDDEIGRVLDAIDQKAPDALVIYTSDHGDAMVSHWLKSKGPCVYDDIARIPLIVRWPGRQTPGGVCPHPMSHIDIVPSIMEAFGEPVPKLLEGRSALEAFADPAVCVNDRIFIEFGRYEIDHDGFGGFQPMRAVYDGRYKLAINLLSSDELYDMEEDPHELTNLIDSPEHAAIRDQLHDAVLDWMNRTRDPFRGYYWHRRPWRADAPEATWDYTGMTRQRENEEYEPRQLDYNTGLDMEQATRGK